MQKTKLRPLLEPLVSFKSHVWTSLTSRSDVRVFQISLRHQQALKSDLGFLFQPLMFKFPLKQASQHGPSCSLSLFNA